MFQPITGPSSGETNTKYAKEGNVKMIEVCLLHTYIEFTLKRSVCYSTFSKLCIVNE